MDIKDINQKIIQASKVYKEHLLNRNFLIIYSHCNRMKYYETVCLNVHYKHLTGIKTDIPAKDFFKKCYKSIITPKDYKTANDGSTELKLQVILNAMQFESTAKNVGFFNGKSGINLFSDMVVGNYVYSLGFVKDKNAPRFYVPNTLLKKNIKEVSLNPIGEIICIIEKQVKEKQYHNIMFYRDYFEMVDTDLPSEIMELISDDVKQVIFTSKLTE